MNADQILEFKRLLDSMPLERSEAEKEVSKKLALQNLQIEEDGSFPMMPDLLKDHSFDGLSDTSSSIMVLSPMTRQNISFESESVPIQSVHPDWDQDSLSYLFRFRQTYLEMREELIETILNYWNRHRKMFYEQNKLVPFESLSLAGIDAKMKAVLEKELMALQKQAMTQLREDLCKLLTSKSQVSPSFQNHKRADSSSFTKQYRPRPMD
jgi:hypothetical protein